ncbi:MAG: hypothetical protein AB7I50_20735 [Vicinamibacterales bacterium]
MTLSLLHSTKGFAAACAVAFLLGHLPFLATSLEDVDSVNFALGLRDYDVAAHRPHPPGYPVFVGVAKVVRLATGLLMPDAGVDRVDAFTLSLMGVLAGALLAFPLLQVFRTFEEHDGRAKAAVVLTMASPLVWFTAARPLSDMAGLLAATTVQALLLTAWRRQVSQRASTQAVTGTDLMASGRLIVLGAFLAGVAIGVRSQTAWLLAPVLLFVLTHRAGRGAAGALLGASLTFGFGVLLWAVPLLWVSGGPLRYWQALTGQAAEDLTGVDLLARNPTLGRLASGLVDTLVEPWIGSWLAVPVLGLALVGGLALLRRVPATALVLALAVVPYAAFHLIFQETFTTRYALPLVPALCYLAVRGLSVGGPTVMTVATIVLATAGMAPTAAALASYASQGSPVSRVVADLRTGLARQQPTGYALFMNHPFSIALRDDSFNAERLRSATRRQWMVMTDYWLKGGDRPVWFLAEPGTNGLERHHELSLIDRTHRVLRGSYRWGFPSIPFVGGARPSEVDWYEIAQPGWFATEGWALTPELAGAARLDRAGPATAPIVAYVRRRADEAVVLTGGRNLGRFDAPAVRFDLAIDGRPLRSWTVNPDPGFFFDIWRLEPGQLSGDGPFARLEIAARAADGGGRSVEAAIEQFDVQPAASGVYGFAEGWHEQEYAPATGRLWRWMPDRAVLRVAGAPGQTVICRIQGESSLPYYDRPSRLTLRAGTLVLGERTIDADYDWEVAVPADALLAAGGVLTFSTDQTFVPDERSRNGDRRRLGLRIYNVEVRANTAHTR